MKIRKLFALSLPVCLAFFTTAFVKKASNDTPTADGQSFVEFLSHFEKATLPFSIGLDDMDGYATVRPKGRQMAFSNRKTMRRSPISSSEFIPEARFGKMSRMGPPDIQPLARFYPNENMVAVIYSTKQQFGDDISKYYNLIVYDMRGNVMSKSKEFMSFPIAHSAIETTGTCTIDASGHVWTNSYQNIWKRNVVNEGYVGNELVNFKLTETEVFKINAKGKLEQIKDYPVSSRASLN